jgi:hypothetical protein
MQAVVDLAVSVDAAMGIVDASLLGRAIIFGQWFVPTARYSYHR